MLPNIHEAVAARCARHGLPITAQGVEMVTRFAGEAQAIHDRATGRQAERLGRGVQGAGVHGGING